MMFRGLSASEQEPYATWFFKWSLWVKLFDVLHDEYGNYIHYPLSGGYWEQPAVTMEILNVIRSIYKEERERAERSRSKNQNYGKRFN